MSKNRFGKFWNFDPWWPQFWPEPKNDRNDFEMIFRELSNAAFCFSLRRPGAEIMGGGRSNAPPPPSRRWKIQRPSRAQVKAASVCDTWWWWRRNYWKEDMRKRGFMKYWRNFNCIEMWNQMLITEKKFTVEELSFSTPGKLFQKFSKALFVLIQLFECRLTIPGLF